MLGGIEKYSLIPQKVFFLEFINVKVFFKCLVKHFMFNIIKIHMVNVM